MPVYEFGCNACGARLSLFVRSMTSEVSGVCDRCGSSDLRRVVSKFAVVRGPVDPKNLNKQAMLDGVDFGNPKSMANFFRRMGDDFHDEPNEHMDEIIKRLESESRMHPAGIAEVERAKADGRWKAAYAGPSSIKVPRQLAAALAAEPKAKKMFANLNSQNRYAILYRVTTAARPQTRAQRIEKFVAMLARGETIYPQKP